MPYRAPRPCSARDCPNLVIGKIRYCGKHQDKEIEDRKRREQYRKRYDKKRGSAHKRGYGQQWRGLRTVVLNRNPICNICKINPATDVDHIIPKPLGTDELCNLQALCKSCHSRKTAKTDGGFGN